MKRLNHYRKTFTFLFPNGAAGAGLVQSLAMPYAGEILHIHQINGSNTNAATAKLEVINELGQTIFDGTAKNHNASYDHEFVTIRRCLAGADSLRCTISADPGATGYKIDVVVSVFGRDA